MIIACIGTNCSKKESCAKYIAEIKKAACSNEIFQFIDYSTYSNGKVDITSNRTIYLCGDNSYEFTYFEEIQK